MAVLRQVTVCRAPMTQDDLAFALSPAAGTNDAAWEGDRPDLTAMRDDVNRLTDLTLFSLGDGIVMHPWTAELVTGNLGNNFSEQHARALAMRLRRFEQRHGTYDDLIDIPRHLAALGNYDDIIGVARQATQILPGTLAVVACLAEIRPLIPPAERAWTIVADFEVQALLSAGDLPSATQQLRAIHHQVQARAAADPGDPQRQYDLSISHERLGDAAVAAGDLTAATTAYLATREIAAKLASSPHAEPLWQRELSVSHNKLGNVAAAAGDLAAARTAYQASLDIAARLAAADPANVGWRRDLETMQQKIDDLSHSSGT
jgi:tetratricopeptide (TPR) repeat protein